MSSDARTLFNKIWELTNEAEHDNELIDALITALVALTRIENYRLEKLLDDIEECWEFAESDEET